MFQSTNVKYDFEINYDRDLDTIRFCYAIWNIIRYAVPSVLTVYFEYSILVINLGFAASMENGVYLKAARIGNIIIFVTWFSVIIGLNGSLDTLVSQASGAKMYYIWGWYLNRARIVQITIFPIFITYLYTKDILAILGIDRITGAVVQMYLTYFLPGIFAYAQYETVKRFLQNVGNFSIAMYVQSIWFIFHCMLGYVMRFHTNLGMKGIGLSSSISYIFSWLLINISLFYYRKRLPDRILHLDSNSFKNISRMLKFGLLSWIMMVTRISGFGVISYFIRMTNSDQTQASLILYIYFCYFIKTSCGISYSVSYWIGYKIGQKQPNSARKYLIVSTFLTVVFISLLTTLIILMKFYVPLLYSTDWAVNKIVEELLPISCSAMLFETVNVGKISILKPFHSNI